MQEEVNQKTVALSIRTTKLTGKVLAAALGKVARAAQKHHRKALTPQGRQSVKKLMNHYGGKSAMPYVGAPKDFDRIAKEFHVDYAFREAVLPLNPELQASLTTEGISPELRACAVCGKAFLPEGRQAYCSDACKAEGNRRKSRERMRKMREKRPGGCYDLPPPKA